MPRHDFWRQTLDFERIFIWDSGFNEIITMDDGVSLKYMFTDALGFVTAVYDAATSTAEFTTYDTYGNNRNNKLVTVPYYIMKTTVFMLLGLLLFGCMNKNFEKTELINDFSDREPLKYNIEEWQKLGFDVWKPFYTAERWEIIRRNEIPMNYEMDKINYLIQKVEKEKRLQIDRNQIVIVAQILQERQVPVHSWFWFDSKSRIIFACYRIEYNDLLLATVPVSLPSTE